MKRIFTAPRLFALAVIFTLLRAAWSLFAVRNLWFDEALTVLNFALLPTAGDIYANYIIPNNHILYTVLLHWLIQLETSAVVWRLISLAAGFGMLGALWMLFRRRLGGKVLAAVIAALGCSTPFLIHASGLRGYIFGALLTTLALRCALDFAEHRKSVISWCGWAVLSLLSIGVIPSNLAALAGAVLFVTPVFGPKFFKQSRFWLIALTPPVMFLLFYGPIAPRLVAAGRLGEGWRSGAASLGFTALALMAIFGALLPLAAAGVAAEIKRGRWFRPLCGAGIFAIPLAMCLILPVAPFPRVFFPFFPLFALLVAGGLRAMHLGARPLYCAMLLIGGAAWSTLLTTGQAARIQSDLAAPYGDDDYFAPRWVRDPFEPQDAINQLSSRLGDKTPVIYMSFAADPWALMFYGQQAGVSLDRFCFDGPQGKVAALSPGAIVILRSGESAAPLEKRFGLKLEKVSQHGLVIYVAR
ncbi:MAG: hypothetical protein PHI35_08165 [Victivallaceae bacterium]|nr:hypothetical protein [Victivallaceae bacterium]